MPKPEVGQNTVSEPATAVVTSLVAPEPVAEVVAEPAVVVAEPVAIEPFDDANPTILTEDRGEVPAPAGTYYQDFRVRLSSGAVYEHSSNHANGRWIYRRVN